LATNERIRAARAFRVLRRRRGLSDAGRPGGGLLQHLAKNHLLPDANQPATFVPTARFLNASGLPWGRLMPRDTGVVEHVAAGDASHDEVMAWISESAREKGDKGSPSP
jgi:hypothetical protein